MAVMRAKSAYLIEKIDREIAKSGPAAAPPPVAEAKPAPEPASPPVAAAPPAAKEPTPSLSPVRPTETANAEPPRSSEQPRSVEPPVVAEAPPSAEPPPATAPQKREEPKVADEKESDSTSSWSTTTAQAVIPPPPLPRGQPNDGVAPNYDAPPPGTPYELPPPEGEDGASAFDAEGGGYTIDEIREATRGFFGTVSTSLASVIEHAFQKSGRPTAYVLGTEGGGAFLAGLRYGEGTLYLRNGGSQKVYWHGPSIGYDVGAEGSRTLFLIYDLHEPETLFRRFTGVDGSAYLVGGVGMTLLKGGPVMMAPIRSGLGLRIGASIGYVRFSPRPTWNPF
ncbi:MAG: DUF1134 domain-containing protein [Hyphomicrobium sp.]|nr:DUF1134 domain-containing protein [Hyphomicrobium sp.]